MNVIDNGEYFTCSSDKQREAARRVIQLISKGVNDKGRIVEVLNKEVYDQRQDCKDLVRNLILSSNHAVRNISEREVDLKAENGVAAK